jgi:hypothetical protein
VCFLIVAIDGFDTAAIGFIAPTIRSEWELSAAALAAEFYPTDCRATGVAWANGVGRIGSIVGSMGGGAMLSLGWGLPTVFLVVGSRWLSPDNHVCHGEIPSRAG